MLHQSLSGSADDPDNYVCLSSAVTKLITSVISKRLQNDDVNLISKNQIGFSNFRTTDHLLTIKAPLLKVAKNFMHVLLILNSVVFNSSL